jgi:ATP-binding cassette subfamily F protein uup
MGFMNLISAQKISKTLTQSPLFEDVSFGIDHTDRVGLIGANGAGKSTLLRVLLKKLEPDSGSVTHNNSLTVGMLSQQVNIQEDETLKEFLFRDASSAVASYMRFQELSASYTHTPAETQELVHLTQLMDAESLWDLEYRYASLLQELGLEDTSVRFDVLSGGMLKKAALARVLAAAPGLLVLDEPTNHLDISTIEWLESYILSHQMAVLAVTHDRYFLDSVCNRIFELDSQQVFITEGGYEQSLIKKQQRDVEKQKYQQRLETVLRREMEWLNRGPKARTGKDKQRTRRVYELKAQRQGAKEEGTEFSSNQRRLGKKILKLKHLNKEYDGKPVIDDFSYSFSKGERIGILGDNGTGKTTLLELIAGRIEPDSGSIDQGINTHVGYYDQHSSPLQADKTVLEFLEDIREQITLSDGSSVSVPRFLEMFSFPAHMHRQPLSLLSGGEQRRLYLISVLMSDPNFLLLDEPTNDLDIDTMERLEDYLEQFSGCVLIVSHDRAFLDRTTDELFVCEPGARIRKVSGSYSQYRSMMLSETTKQKSKPFSQSTRNDRPRKRKISFNERRELEELLPKIDAMEERKAELEELFSDPQVVPEKLVRFHQEYEQLIVEIEQSVDRWETLAQLEQESQ